MADPHPAEADRPDDEPQEPAPGGAAATEPEAVPVPDEEAAFEVVDRADGADGDAEVVDRADDADGDGPVGGELSVESLVTDLERVTGERDQFRDAYQRSAADLDNFRKQSQRRLDDAVSRSLAGFVERLLPALDACDAALAHGATEVEPILTSLYQALEKEGLARVAPIGEPFDPSVAEAVVHEPGEGGEHVVSEVLRTGYTWNGRVLRPAMVKVTD